MTGSTRGAQQGYTAPRWDVQGAGRAKWCPKRFLSSPSLPLLAVHALSLSHWQDAEGLQHNLAVLLWYRNALWSWGNCATQEQRHQNKQHLHEN